MLMRLNQSVGQRFGDVVKVDELLDARLHLVVLLRALVQPQHDGRHVPEYGGAH